MSTFVVLPGSERLHPANAEASGPLNPEEVITLTLVLRRKTAAPATIESHLLHAEHAELHGACEQDIAAIEAFAQEHGFCVQRVHQASRTVKLSGRVADLASVFGADVQLSRVGSRHMRTRQGALRVPEHLKNVITAVLGFDERPTAATYHCVHPRAAAGTSFTPRELASIYNFPTNVGSGQTIALIELGGGYRDADLQTYWKSLGLKNVAVESVSVDGAQNAPTGDPNGPDGEVALDIQVAGAMAPGANIAVYFAANSDAGFLDAINAAIHDSVRKPSVISISWGGAECNWTGQSMNAYNAAFHDATLLGITVTAAAGDNGSSDGVGDGKVHVDFPASSPWVLACGGTRLSAQNGERVSETVWNDGTQGGATGGGFSNHFARPAYQSNIHLTKAVAAHTTGRGVPDVAAVADPASGYQVLIDGQACVMGGTSAVAPLWAALVAVCNQAVGKHGGWIHPVLYGTAANTGALNDVQSGTNGAYRANVGWDACTGLGTPNGIGVLNALKG